MKLLNVWTKAFLIAVIACSTITLSAQSPKVPPPRGHAYGYYLKDGGQVLFIYLEEDGSRIIDLSNCRPRTRYAIEASEDLVAWRTVATVEIQSDGTATFVDTAPMPYCFYQVTRVK